MKFLQVHCFYERYLEGFYERHPGLASLPFPGQMEALRLDAFSASHLMANFLPAHGVESQLVVANYKPAQFRWAADRGLQPDEEHWFHQIVLAQITEYCPDVLYLSHPIDFHSWFVRLIPSRPKLVMGWRAAPIPEGCDFSEFDLMLSSDPVTKELLKQKGAKKVMHFVPGYPTFVNEIIKNERTLYDVVFSGQVDKDHEKRNEMLKVVGKAPLGWQGEFSIGYFLAVNPSYSMPAGIAMHDRGARWGVEMFRAMKQGKIALNGVIDFADSEAGNMRQFEITGAGTFMLTEAHHRLADYFEPGREVETYASNEELLEKIYYYLQHDKEREEIAARGQLRCLNEHSMELRSGQFLEIVENTLGVPCRKKVEAPLPVAVAQDCVSDSIAEAIELLERGSLSDALDEFERILTAPDAPNEVNYGKAIAQARLGRAADAVSTLQLLLSSSPGHVKGRMLLEELSAQNEHGQQSRRAQEQALDKALSALGEGRAEEARALLAKTSMKPAIPNINYTLALCLAEMNRTDEALAALRAEVMAYPDNEAALDLMTELASIKVELGS